MLSNKHLLLNKLMWKQIDLNVFGCRVTNSTKTNPCCWSSLQHDWQFYFEIGEFNLQREVCSEEIWLKNWVSDRVFVKWTPVTQPWGEVRTQYFFIQLTLTFSSAAIGSQNLFLYYKYSCDCIVVLLIQIFRSSRIFWLLLVNICL